LIQNKALTGSLRVEKDSSGFAASLGGTPVNAQTDMASAEPASPSSPPPPSSASPPALVVNTLDPGVIGEVLARGWRDFRTAPWFGLFFGLVYASGGWAVVMLAALSGYYFLAYPLAAGFALVAPFVAAGLYEVSRRLEAGEPLQWSPVLSVVVRGSSREIGWMALVTGFTLFIWLDVAFFTYAIFFGLQAPSMSQLFIAITTTWHGALFFLVGNAIGVAISFFLFSVTVVSMPMLIDRDVDFVTAMIASVRTVRQNLRVMLLWALVIAAALFLSALTLLIGLIVVLPVLGHATWHMYRAAIARP